MKLLVLTPQLPYPPRQGTAIRNWGLIRHLSRRHTVTLLSFQTAEQSAPAGELLTACARIETVPAPRRSRLDRIAGLLRPEPDLARRLWSPALAAALQRLLAEQAFDVIQVEGLELAPYLNGGRAAQPAARLIYDAHNVEYRLQRRAGQTDWARPARWPAAAYSSVQWPRLRAFEAATLRAVDAAACVSEEDRAALQALAPGRRLALVPNGLDVDEYAAGVPAAITPAAITPAAEAGAAPSVVFTGKMDYRPNVDAALWFAAEIWPRLRAERPEARALIVGQQPTPAVRALDGRDGLSVTGAVADTRPYIAGAEVYVAPLRMGGGTRFKLLEAMALGRPIVSTTLGAEGFLVRDRRELRLADTAEAFAAAVLEVWRDPAHGAALGAAGRAFARARYDWRVILPELEALYALTAQSG